MKSLTFETCQLLLTYEPLTGKFYWKPRAAGLITPSHNRTPQEAAEKWNRRYAGAEAFTSTMNTGYMQGRVNKEHHLAHRVAWLSSYGAWPDQQIDHINGDRSDNRLANLRAVSPQENRLNTRRPANNTSGHVGVYWVPHIHKWNARINKNRTPINLGYFSELEDAVAARKRAATNLKFHPNHGRD